MLAMASSARTTPTPSLSLRPRTRRLIPGLSDDDEIDLDGDRGSTRIASPRGTPHASRTGSPNKHPLIRTSATLNVGSAGNGTTVGQRGGGAIGSRESSGAFSWSASWTALQGLASNVLGAEVGGVMKDSSSTSGVRSRRRRPFEATLGHRKTTSSAPPAQWGPSGLPQLEVGAGSTEQRDTEVRARKRKELLSGGDVWDGGIDSAGRYKRRTSEDTTRPTISIAEGGAPVEATEESDGDALVYIHQVKPQDTLAGVAIRYNCQQVVLRKANRMWAQDNVQTRKVVMIPVDSSGVKGKPISEPLLEANLEQEEEDLLQLGKPSSAIGHPKSTSAPLSQPGLDPLSSTVSNADSESAWKHDSWVLLPDDAEPTEIGRLPRRTLGFFPSARRKSFCYSDGTTNSPSVSFELSRPQLSPFATARPSFTSESVEPTTTQPPILAALRNTNRPARSSSLVSSATNTSHASPPLWLQGPGGVGTLDKTSRTPGPAQDSLNRLLAPHFPNVQPPPGTTFNPPPSFPSILDDYDHSFKIGAYSSSYGGGGASGFAANLSGVEKWVRKTATSMQKTYSQLSDSSTSANRRTPGVRGVISPAAAGLAKPGGVGDLIELVDAFEVGNEDDAHIMPTASNANIAGVGWGVGSSNTGKGKANALPVSPMRMSQRRVGGGEISKDD